MRARATAVLVAALALAAGGCGGSEPEPFRVGILSDCYGPFSSAHERIVASAELPLIRRGGTLGGRNPSDGVDGASAAGRRVELLVGCVTGTGDVIPEARRLVEEEHAAVLVGPLYPQHGLVLRDYARRRPETAFVIQPSGAPELTLTKPAPNVFRFTADNAQSAAGLGSYAYHELGWRTATTVADDTPYGWGNVAGFVAEFCALGGRVVDRRWVPPLSDPTGIAPRIPDSVDGVYLGAAISPMRGFVQRYSDRHPHGARRLLASAALLYNPQIVAGAPGMVAAGPLALQPTRAEQEHIAAFAKAFPRIPAASALDPLAVPFHDGVEAAVEALERTHGATGRKLMAALAGLELETVGGPVHLDANRQAVAPNYLTRVTRDARGKPVTRTLEVVGGVEHTFGGYFRPTDPPPSRTAPACRKANPPPWARR
jgi:branched-chain amino acid transport system substrate-binding protein